ncbi:putative Pentatricopeptide repeat-containing protein [Quillaja saponaria]|uniref:Pentatricopeptide repeat-containing protein n=1 Tax=Quillaja saponaria TaxID=32244 RepID=A0AAD7P909_QUISA|nr:putative Pentatricopeptide repeat-containing protein [Quillaja saponaria]
MSSLSRLRGLFTSNPSFKSKTNILKSTSTNKKPLPEEVDFQNVVNKFKESSESHEFRKKRSIYETTVRRLAKAQKYSMIEEILESQKKYKDMSCEGFVIRLIYLYGISGLVDHAQKLFDEMPQFDCERTVKSFNTLLSAYAYAKNFDKVVEFFREMPSKISIQANEVSYNIVIHAFCEMGSLDLAMSMVDEMEKNGIGPTFVTFGTLLDAFYKNSRYMDGEKIWALMESKNVEPSVRCYSSRLRGMVSDSRISEAVELIDEMRQKGLKPDVFIFNTLIKGFCDDGNMQEAKHWYDELKKHDCSPDKITYMTIVPFLCKEGDLDMAMELCKEAINRRSLADVAVLKCVTDGLHKEGKTEKASELLKLGKSKKYQIDNI